jgi:hypothetical protein
MARAIGKDFSTISSGLYLRGGDPLPAAALWVAKLCRQWLFRSSYDLQLRGGCLGCLDDL